MHLRWAPALLLVLLLAAACSGDDGAEATTTTAAAGGTVTSTTSGASNDAAAASDVETTMAAGNTTTTTLVANETRGPTFTIVGRTPGDEGDTVVVLLDPESYESLTDIDLYNVLSEVVDDFPPVLEAHVIDSEEVASLVTMAPEELDAEAQRLLDLHYLVRLDEGFRITYVGRFADAGSDILGS